jgi:NAD+ synthase (glutamine-hydrolysing)
MALPFHSPYRHGFVRVAACVPHGRVADPAHNAERVLVLARQASEAGAALAVFPELGLSAYSDDDLFHQDALQSAVLQGLATVVSGSRDLACIVLVGAPLALEDRLYNCAVAVYRGRILGVVPKRFLPNYREFYEKRHFTSGRQARATEIALLENVVPFGCDLLFHASAAPGFVFHVELCEDLWVPIPPSTYAAMAGATVLANLSASNATVGKSAYRRNLCVMQSARCMAGYVYSGAGFGESTTDLAWDGHALICENGDLLAESQRFAAEEQVVIADIDVDRLRQDRTRMTSYADASDEEAERLRRWRTVAFDFAVPRAPLPLRRRVPRFPYVPADPVVRDERCADVYQIQVQGLAKRLASTGIDKVVIGVSGGLDSAHALTVAVKAMEWLGQPRSNVLAYTMPGFATSQHTLRNATALMKAMGVSGNRLDIRPAARRMLRDIGHPAARGQPVYDVTFENVQAGIRTAYLFRLANRHGGLVVGTSDLSELALGWTTYGVGDQMSHYAVNASVPKTLIQYLVRWVIATHQFDAATRRVLQRILDTAISPELVPSSTGETIGQRSEEIVGPFALQDFFLYYITRFGFRPSKVAFLAQQAWEDAERGEWPSELPARDRRSYSLREIVHWLEVFLERFFHSSQFKRSALPNAPKVGSGGSLSPRGDWRAPSDSEARVWLDELHRNVPPLP